MQRTLAAPLTPVAPLDVFSGSLASYQNPSFLAPLGHQVDPRAGGVAEGLADLAPGKPQAYASRADLPVPTTADPPPRVQRRAATGPAVPGSTAVPAPEVQAPDLAEPRFPGQPSDPVPSSLAAAAPVAPATAAVPPPLPVQRQIPAEPERPVFAVPERRLSAVPDRVPRRAILPPLPLVDLPVVVSRSASDRSGPDASGPDAWSEPSAPELGASAWPTGEPPAAEPPAAEPPTAGPLVPDAEARPPDAESPAPLSGFAAAVSTLQTNGEVPDSRRGVTELAGEQIEAAAPVVLRASAESTPTRPPLPPVTRAADAVSPPAAGSSRAGSGSEPAVQRAGRPAPLLGRPDARRGPEDPSAEGLSSAAESWRPPAASLPHDGLPELPELPVVSRWTAGDDWSPERRLPSWGQVGGSGEQAIPSVGLLSPLRPLVDHSPAAPDVEVVQRVDYLSVPFSMTSTGPAARVRNVALPAAEAGPTLQRAAPVGISTAPVGTATAWVGTPSPAREAWPQAAALPAPITAGPAPTDGPGSAPSRGQQSALVPPPADVTSDGGAPDAYGAAVPVQAWTEVALPPADLATAVTAPGEPRPSVALQRQSLGAGPQPPGGSMEASRAPEDARVASPVVLRQRATQPTPTFGAASAGGASFAHLFAASESPVMQREPAEEPANPPEAAAAAPAALPAGAPTPLAGVPAPAVGTRAGGAGPSATELEEMARRLYEPLSARLRAELWLDRERSGMLL